MKRLLFGGYFLTILALFLYSYTQVDLSLTLSKQSIIQTIEKSFQYVGYFNRPLSTLLFLIIVGALFLFYVLLLRLISLGKLHRKHVWIIILISVGILTFSYNAFSYDFFNYIFYGKIITHYHQNPYFVKALDFPHEPMLSFMHWTQNTYPYGPFWLILTAPLSFIGANYFLLTFFIFKIFSGVTLLGSFWLIEKIAKKINPKYVLFSLAFFALNPLTLVEGIVSAHNDATMMFFAILGIYLFIQKKKILGILSLIASWQTKEATAFILIPSVFYLIGGIIKKQFLTERNFVRLCGVFMILAFLYLISFREAQPWYLLWILPFAGFIWINRYFLSIVVGISLGLLLRYVPFLYQGDWNGNAPAIQLYVSLFTPVVFVVIYFFWNQFQKRVT